MNTFLRANQVDGTVLVTNQKRVTVKKVPPAWWRLIKPSIPVFRIYLFRDGRYCFRSTNIFVCIITLFHSAPLPILPLLISWDNPIHADGKGEMKPLGLFRLGNFQALSSASTGKRKCPNLLNCFHLGFMIVGGKGLSPNCFLLVFLAR